MFNNIIYRNIISYLDKSNIEIELISKSFKEIREQFYKFKVLDKYPKLVFINDNLSFNFTNDEYNLWGCPFNKRIPKCPIRFWKFLYLFEQNQKIHSFTFNIRKNKELFIISHNLNKIYFFNMPNEFYKGNHNKSFCKSSLGFYQYNNGSTYSGNFLNNLLDGFGIYTWNSGSYYIGDWKKDEKHGFGTFVHMNGNIVSTEWKRNQPINIESTYTEDTKNCILSKICVNNAIDYFGNIFYYCDKCKNIFCEVCNKKCCDENGKKVISWSSLKKCSSLQFKSNNLLKN